MQNCRELLRQPRRSEDSEGSEDLEESLKLLTRLRKTVSSVRPEDLLQLSDLSVLFDALEILEGLRQKSIFNRLPKPVVEKVLVCLTATDLARCSGVNKEWHVLATRIAKRRYLALRDKRKVDRSFYPNWSIDPIPDSVTWITQLRAKEIEYSTVHPYATTTPMLQVPAVISLFPIPLEVTNCGFAPVNGLYYNTSLSQTGLIFSKRLPNQSTCFIHKLYSGQISWWYLSLRNQEGTCVQICHASELSEEALLIMPLTNWVCFNEDHNPPPTIELRRDLRLSSAHQTFLWDITRERSE